MFFKEAISASLLGSLNELMAMDELKLLRLVGGTALALQMGHRESVDIELFGQHDLEDVDLLRNLSVFPVLQRLRNSHSIQVFLIQDVKLDIVNYPYPWLDPPVIEQGIRMASARDIAAMKISAITNRGSRKDFVDLYFLMQEFSLEEILDFYMEKFRDANRWLALRSLPYFEDAEMEPMPKMLHDIFWTDVKSTISRAVFDLAGFDE